MLPVILSENPVLALMMSWKLVILSSTTTYNHPKLVPSLISIKQRFF
jgi:hypothetical protein